MKNEINSDARNSDDASACCAGHFIVSDEHFTVGARGSKLSLAQTNGAIRFLKEQFPSTSYEVVSVSTPGDRDLTTPIEKSASDFFTRDLDEAVLAGRIDFAIHSAKDLPEEISDGLDWFWLANREDPRDCWVYRKGASGSVSKIGISSERRKEYALKRFPGAQLLPIRGAIDSRIAQLCEGKYDAVLMAMAGIKRLYSVPTDGKETEALSETLPEGIEIEPIEIEELTPPEAQGYLCVVFRAGDERLMKMRERFVKAVRFVSAGVGDADYCTLAGARDLKYADVVLYDDLMGDALLARCPREAKLIHVGKRCGAHSMKQNEITELICDEARKGRRVVRLKGGDAGLFGRLAEETDALSELKIPFVVRAGVSALTAATTGTGLLLTRRGESRGFTVFTPRSTGTETPLVMFMATQRIEEECGKLIAGGYDAQTPCALVLDAAGAGEEVRRMTLGTAKNLDNDLRAGLFIVGNVAKHVWPKLGELAGRRVLLTCSEAVQERLALQIEDKGGKPVKFPLIKLVARKIDFEEGGYDALVFTSPSSVRIFFENVDCDIRKIPLVYTCGSGTDAELRKFGLRSDVMPAGDYSAKGLIAEIEKRDLCGKRVLRLRSAKAGGQVAEALRKAGAQVDDVILYDNHFTAPAGGLPDFDDVFFASASGVESFVAQFGVQALAGKMIHVIGEPTRKALETLTGMNAGTQKFFWFL